MLPPTLKTLAEAHVFLVDAKARRLPFRLHGITRLVDPRGHTLGIVIDKKTLDEIEEDLEAQSPRFRASLDASRRSGRVSAKTVKRKAGLG